MNPNGVTAKSDSTPLEIALLSPTNFEIVSLLAAYMEFPEPQKLQYLRLMLQTDDKVSLEDFKKCLTSVPLEKVRKGQARFSPDSTFLFLLSLTRRRLSLRNLAVDFITTWKVTGAIKVMCTQDPLSTKVEKTCRHCKHVCAMSPYPHIPISLLLC